MLASEQQIEQRVDRRLVLILAAGAGAAVANLYYAQPLLPEIAATWGLSSGAAASVVTVGQLGYALGLLFLVPLGDSIERRKLIVRLLGIVTVSLLAAAAAQSLLWLIFASFAIGFAGITPQILLPFAADLAGPRERGRVVGAVMSGLLVGVLLARTISGAVGGWLGWRAMYVLAAVGMILLAAVLRSMLPESTPRSPHLNYGELLRSLIHLIRDEPVLRVSSVLGAMSFASFSAFWTVLPFLLAGPPYHYSTVMIGLFGLIGVMGVAVAPVAGRLSDAGRGRVAIGAAFWLILLSYAVLWGGASNLTLLIAGVLLLDLGATANHISNQARVYGIRPEARSRLNTVYMVTYFTGGSLGSLAGAQAWNYGGWSAFCLAAGAFIAAGLVVYYSVRWPKSGS